MVKLGQEFAPSFRRLSKTFVDDKTAGGRTDSPISWKVLSSTDRILDTVFQRFVWSVKHREVQLLIFIGRYTVRQVGEPMILPIP